MTQIAGCIYCAYIGTNRLAIMQSLRAFKSIKVIKCNLAIV